MKQRLAALLGADHLGLWPVLLVAVGLRLYGLAWDGGYLFHPDERFVLSVAEQVAAWRPAGVVLGRTSPLNPFWNVDEAIPRHFPYGHVTVYLAALAKPLAGSLAAWTGLDPLVAGARLLAALADTLAVGLAFLLGRAVGGPKVGWLAAALLAGTVLHVQYAHFYTADTLLTPFVLAALLAMVRLASDRSPVISARWPLMAGGLVGLAAGVKVTGGLLLLPLLAAHLLAGPTAPPGAWRRWPRPAWGWFGVSALAAGATFALTNPYALLDWPRFLSSLAAEAGMVRGVWVAPFTEQYVGTRPYLYPFAQQARWFLGFLPALVAWGGLLVALARAARGQATRPELVVLAWCVPFVLLVGGLFAKFPRYWLAAVPAMYVLGSRALVELGKRTPRLAGAVAGLTLANALGWAFAFSQIYAQPHPWLQASAWLHEQVPPGAVVALERWDYPLPVPLPGQRAANFRQIELDGYDTTVEPGERRRALERADYVVLASPRVWLPLLRRPEGREGQAAVYRHLLAEEAGFRVVRIWRVEPRLGPVSFRDNPFARAGLPTPAAWFEAPPAPVTVTLGPADEGFEVYDHPLVVVLARQALK